MSAKRLRLCETGRRVAEENFRLGGWAATKLAARGVPEDEAQSDGMLALCQAVVAWVRKGRPAGHKLSTYVGWYVDSVLSHRARAAARPRRGGGWRQVPLRDVRAAEDFRLALVDYRDERGDAK